MVDRTTAGTEAEQDEVEALLHNLCGFHLADRDPVSRYAVLTREQVLYEALAAAIRRERGRALAELVERGHRLTEIAHLTGLRTRQQVQRLIYLGSGQAQATGAQAVADAQEASRQFEERLAAVEATLDEVVSGVPILNESTVPVEELTDDDYDSFMSKEPYVVETFAPGHYATVEPEEPFDPLTGDLDQLTGMLEPTRVMPALSVAVRPARPVPDDDWYRRGDDVDAT
jgi:hypothetical protein